MSPDRIRAVFAHHNYAYKGDQPRTANRDVIAIYVRTDRWKFILYPQALGKHNERYAKMDRMLLPEPLVRAAGEMDLFDLHADPYEQHDLAHDPSHADRLTKLRKQALVWWEQTNGNPLGE